MITLTILLHVQNYFEEAFTTSHILSEKSNLPKSFDHQDLSSLDRPLCDNEIQKALFSFKPYKASGPDGFHHFFYQNYWKTVGPSVITYCQEIFASHHIPLENNSTFICLISKISNANNLKFFRSISLCNIIYKVITKSLLID